MKLLKLLRSPFFIMIALVALAGCGGPKIDVSIFMMGAKGVPSEIGDKLEASLKAKIGETPTLKVFLSPVFSQEKLIVELAAGKNGVIILPNEQIVALAKQGAFVSLDDVFNPADYPDGVMDLAEEGKPAEKHLYGIPLADNKWMKEQGYDGKGLMASIPLDAEKLTEAKQVLKAIAQ